jgi:hypothetical protein
MMNDPTDVDPTIGRWSKQGTPMAVEPISPQGALDLKITNIPDVVIETVNMMLAEKMTKSGYVTLLQKDICDRICAASPGLHNSMIYSNGWLDFEPFYEKAGWKVEYDKPAYCESYEANFKFSRK